VDAEDAIIALIAPTGHDMNAALASAPVELLRHVPLFEDLDHTELQALADSMHERTFLAGEMASAEGAGADGFFVVESGEGQVTVDGQPRAAITAGDYFGEIALMMGSERTATITAKTDLHCFGLTAVDFREVVEGNPSIAWKLAESMMDRLS
jgi:CRP-like cAMP-binding protein